MTDNTNNGYNPNNTKKKYVHRKKKKVKRIRTPEEHVRGIWPVPFGSFA